MSIRKLCVKEVTIYIQDSLYDFYDWLDNILYIVYDEHVSDNFYISIFMIVFGPLKAFATGQIFNTCVLHVMNVIIWTWQ